MRLNSDVQPGMVSRDHLEFTYTKIKSEVNGTLLKRVGEAQSRRVEEGPVEDGDIITFGGARSTEVGETPNKQAKKSIYEYRFTLAMLRALVCRRSTFVLV